MNVVATAMYLIALTMFTKRKVRGSEVTYLRENGKVRPAGESGMLASGLYSLVHPPAVAAHPAWAVPPWSMRMWRARF